MASPVKRHLAARRPALWGRALPGGLGCLALVFGVAALRLRRTVSAVAIQEHGVALEDVCAAVMRLGCTLVCPIRALRCLHATVV
jgi:hypothetical protein